MKMEFMEIGQTQLIETDGLVKEIEIIKPSICAAKYQFQAE
jgi:hypothetical protein